MQSTKAPHGVRHIRISTGQQPQQDDAIFACPAQLRNNHNAFCARVHACLQDDFATRFIANGGIENFEVSKRFPYTPRRFQRKTVALANRQEPQPSHHAPPDTSPKPPTERRQKANHGRRPASKKALTWVDSARANLLGLVCHGHQQRMNCSPKRRACVRCQWQKCKTASDLKHKSLQTALRGGSVFVPRYIPLLDQHD